MTAEIYYSRRTWNFNFLNGFVDKFPSTIIICSDQLYKSVLENDGQKNLSLFNYQGCGDCLTIQRSREYCRAG
jgi:hypothetical protein